MDSKGRMTLARGSPVESPLLGSPRHLCSGDGRQRSRRASVAPRRGLIGAAGARALRPGERRCG
jgi:hypothetical protein